MSPPAPRRVRLVTCPALADGFHDDQPLVPALAAHGVAARFVAWQDIDPNGGPDAEPLLVRTPWDYTDHRDAFRRWLEGFRAAGTPCLNDPALMLWNLDKRYLLDLEARGHAIVPTRLLPAWDEDAARAVADAEGWNHAVAKPVVGAGASGLVRVGPDGVQTFAVDGNAWAPDTAATPEGPCFVQPEVPAIHAEGEWSLFFFGGAYSHAVRKLPADGDLRVQEEHGGRTVTDAPPDATRRAAEAVVADLPGPAPTYARVDGVHHEGRFCLMELEAVEPEMYLRHDARAPARFAAAVAAALPR